MAFQSIDNFRVARFNSSLSSHFLDYYENSLDTFIRNSESEKPSATFAPSSIRCKRISWFRLRGVEPETEEKVDRGLRFTADIGTACHQIIQSTLIGSLQADWIDVKEYLAGLNPPYKYKCEQLGFETRIEVLDPPIKFAPDGIIRFEGEYRLLEIKTSDRVSFDKLSGPKPNHIDQLKCYCTLLNLHSALMIYQDRQYGDLKCYEVTVTDEDMKEIWDMFRDVQDCVDKNLAPSKPKDTRYCTPSYCRYYSRCKEW